MSKKKIVLGYLFIVLAFVGLLAPITLLFIHNKEIWIEQDATKISTGVIVGLIYVIIVFKGVLKDCSRKTNSLVSMFFFTVVVYFIDSILADLLVISLTIMGGYVIYLILSAIGNKIIKESHIYREEKIRVNVRKEAQSDELMGV